MPETMKLETANGGRVALTANVMREINKTMLAVDKGALKMAINVLRRSGKNEVADELEKTAVHFYGPTTLGA